MTSNQKGFSAVEIVLVVAVVGLIGVVGWLVFSRRDNSVANSEKTSNSSVVQTANKTQAKSENAPQEKVAANAQDQRKFLVVKEWGVKFETSDMAQDVSYEFAPGANNMILLTTPRLAELAKATPVCANADKSIGIARAQIGDDHFGSPWTESELAAVGTKIGQYYYYSDGGKSCFGQEAELQKYSAAIAEIGSIRASLTQLAKTVQAN